MQYLEEYAVIQDIQIYLNYYYTEETTKAFFKAFSPNPEKVLQPYYLFRAKTGRQLPPFLLPFLYKLEERYSLLSLFLDYTNFRPRDLEKTVQMLSNIPSLQESMLRHYFQGKGYIPDRTDIEEGRISPLVCSLELPEDIKVYLCYCLEHMDIASQTLIELFRYYYPLMKELHREYAPVQESMERDLRNGNLRLLEEIYGQQLPPDEFHWAMSVMNPCMIFGGTCPTLLCLGVDYTAYIEHKITCSRVSINGFLDRLSDKDRRKLFNFIKERPRYTRELASIMKLPWDIIQKHLDHLRTENILYIYENNENYYYSIYPAYFSALAERYREYAQKLETLQPAKIAAEENALYLPEKVEQGDYLTEYAILFNEAVFLSFYFASQEELRRSNEIAQEEEDSLQVFYRLRALASREIPPALKPFFYFDKEHYYFLPYYILIETDPFTLTLQGLIDRIWDTAAFTQALLKHYFNREDAIPSPEDMANGRLPDFVKKLQVPEEIRIYLVYCLEHMPQVQALLEEELRALYPATAKVHAEQQSIIDAIAAHLTDPKQLRRLSTDFGITEALPHIRGWALTFINKNTGFTKGLESFYVFNPRAAKGFRGQSVQNCTPESYLDAASDPDRRKIIDYITPLEKSTRHELLPVLGCTQSTLNRHMDILLQEGILYSAEKMENFFYYKLNIPYFYMLADKLDTLAKEFLAQQAAPGASAAE